jgi:transcriptional regulator with XRE-family HTH domain
MVDNNKSPKLVGSFIRQRREALNLSQRALGQMFTPPVTTQFISNVERGVTPLPPNHVPTLTKALLVSEKELLDLLEKEYTAKLSGRLGKAEANDTAITSAQSAELTQIVVVPEDYQFMRKLYDAFRLADEKTRQAFATVCESMLNVTIKKPDNDVPDGE